jgi:hydroxymethylbilane synthase
MKRQTLIVGTRGSALAQAQTALVEAALRRVAPNVVIEVRVIRTQGDVRLDRPVTQIGGKGVFVREIENALLARVIDLAVHSLKDLPVEQPPGLIVAAIPPREDPRDVLVSRDGRRLSELPAGARVGTGSQRRAVQLRAMRPDLEVHDLRGNVDTRLHKLDTGQYDAIVLAAAGLGRLGRLDRVVEFFDPEVMTPAPGQGALAVECRAADEATQSLLLPVHDLPTWAAVTAERAFLSGLGGGCSAPIAAYAEARSATLRLHGLVASFDGRQVVRVSGDGSVEQPGRLGYRLAEEALAQGASAILEGIP